ncbi:MAG: rane protein [Mycobacterium sp.]|jgi:hypothetical protein|nr:rane protein [Mycobacterium sp.]
MMSDNSPVDVSKATVEPLFHEPGASWYWVLAGPITAIAMLLIELHARVPGPWIVPGCFLALVSGFIALQVKAARIHTSVELTRDTLRQGTEVIAVDRVERIYPEPGPGAESAKWQSARALGELSGVPRGRVGIGIKLGGGVVAQAWARRHRELRAALTELLQTRRPPGTDQ